MAFVALKHEGEKRPLSVINAIHPDARVITILYPEAKATVVSELVNKEVILLATKILLVLAMKLLFNHSIDRTSPYRCGFSSLYGLAACLEATWLAEA